MSYDGFYGELSTRGTVNDLLSQADSIKASIEASEAAVAADTSDVDWKHAEVTLKAAQVQTDANLVSMKAQEVKANADYVAGAVLDSSLVVIDDAAGLGTTNVTWSADKSSKELNGKVDKVTGKGLSESDYTTAEKTKLAGVAVGATKNATDDQLRDRATHTGAQVISTITGLQGALDSKVNSTSLGTAATKNLTTSNTDGTAGRVLKVGDGGWMGQGVNLVAPYGYPSSIGDDTNQTKVIRSENIDNGVGSFAAGIHFAAHDTWGRLRVSYIEPKAWIQGGNANAGTGWTSQVVLSANMLQATGVSTELPMSQAAVTNAINNNSSIGIGQTWQDVRSERASGTTYTNTSGRPIQVAVSALQNVANYAASVTMTVGGVSITNTSYGATQRAALVMIVPVGETYSVSLSPATPSQWIELRS